MRIVIALIAFSVTPLLLAAQQSNDNKSAVDYHCDKDQVVKTLCEDMENRDKDAQQKLIADEAKKLRESLQHADETKKVITDVNNTLSTDKGTQIDGVTGGAQDVNQRANGGPVYGNTVSKDVTDKSISLLDRLERQENVITENVANAARSAAQTPTNSSSSFASQQHQLNESTRGEAGTPQTSLEQRLQQQERVVVSSPRAKTAVASNESTKNADMTQSLDRRLQDKEANIMSSASSVKAMAAADRRMEAEAQARRAEETRQEAARQAELAAQARAQADEKRIAEQEEDARVAAQRRIDDRDDRIEAAKLARQQQALYRALIGPPPVQSAPYIPSYMPSPAYSSGYTPAYDPSSPPVSSNSTTGSHSLFDIYKTPNTVNSGYTHYDFTPCISIVNAAATMSCIKNAPLLDSNGQTVAPDAQTGSSQGQIPATQSAAPATSSAASPASAPKTAP